MMEHPVGEGGSGDGFVLIDTLVALLILAMIAALMTMFVTQFQTVKRIESKARERAELVAATRFLETTLASALPLPLMGNTNGLVLVGGADRVRLVGRLPRGFRTASLRDVELGPASIDEGGLRLRSRARRADTPEASDIVIDEAVAAASFAYLGPDGVWADSWENRVLPVAIRFKISRIPRADSGAQGVSSIAVLRLANPRPQED